MRYAPLTAIALLVLLSLTGASQARGDTSTPSNQLSLKQLPEPLSQSVSAYLRGGNSSAVTTLLNNYPLARSRAGFANKVRQAFAQAESDLSVLLQVEPIFVRRITESYRQYYLLYCYRDGVLFARFDFYRSGNNDYVVDCEFSRDPDKILPPLSENVEY